MSDNTNGVTFYWRQGCGFCTRLHRGLSNHGVTLDMRNIWEDPAHAAVVRSVAGGNETVPTVLVGNVAMVNPSVDQVIAVMHQGK